MTGFPTEFPVNRRWMRAMLRADAAGILTGILTLGLAVLLCAGGAAAQAVCSDTPASGQRISCSEGQASMDDIDIDTRNPAISTTGQYHDAIYGRHSGQGDADVNISVSGGTLKTTGVGAYGIIGIVRRNQGDVSIDTQNVAIETTNRIANGIRGRLYDDGSIDIDVTGGSITTDGTSSHGVIGYHDGYKGAIDVAVKRAAVKAGGAASYGVAALTHPSNAGTVSIGVGVEGGSIETEDRHAVVGYHREGWYSGSHGDVDVSVTGAAVGTNGALRQAVLGAHAGTTGDVTLGVSGAAIVAARGESGVGVYAVRGGGDRFTAASGSVDVTTGAGARISAPFGNGVHGRLASNPGAGGRVVVAHGGAVEARSAGVLAWVEPSSGSTFGDGTPASDDAGRTAPTIHVTSSGDVTVGASVMDAFIANRIAGADGTSAAEQAVLDAIYAGGGGEERA